MRYFKAIRNEDMDDHTSDRPYSVEIIETYDNGHYLEGTDDWSYFSTKQQAETYIEGFNTAIEIMIVNNNK